MVQEVIYKFFIFVRNLCLEVKLIVSVEFIQLRFVKDRAKYCNYKESSALSELCDGQRLELSKNAGDPEIAYLS